MRMLMGLRRDMSSEKLREKINPLRIAAISRQLATIPATLITIVEK